MQRLCVVLARRVLPVVRRGVAARVRLETSEMLGADRVFLDMELPPPFVDDEPSPSERASTLGSSTVSASGDESLSPTAVSAGLKAPDASSSAPRRDALPPPSSSQAASLESVAQRVAALTRDANIPHILQSRERGPATKYLYLLMQLARTRYDRALYLEVVSAMRRDVRMTRELFDDVLKISRRVSDAGLMPQLVSDEASSMGAHGPSLESLESLCLSYRGRVGPTIALYNKMRGGRQHAPGYPPPSPLIVTCIFNSLSREDVSSSFVQSVFEECRRSSVFPSSASLSRFFSVVAKGVTTHNDLIQLLRVFQFSRESNLPLSSYCHAKFIRLCGRNKLAPLGLSLFDSLLESGAEVTPDLYGSVLGCFLDNSALMAQYFRSLRDRHVPLSVHMFNCLLEAHAREGAVARCHALLNEIRAAGMEPNLQSHILVVRSHLACRQFAPGHDYCERLLRGDRRESEQPIGPVSAILLYAAIELCAAEPNHERARHYLQGYRAEGFVLKGRPINQLLSDAIRVWDSESIQFYLEKTREHNGFLSIDTALLLLQRTADRGECEQGLAFASFLIENRLLFRVDADLLAVISGLQREYHRRVGESYALPEMPQQINRLRTPNARAPRRSLDVDSETGIERLLLSSSPSTPSSYLSSSSLETESDSEEFLMGGREERRVPLSVSSQEARETV